MLSRYHQCSGMNRIRIRQLYPGTESVASGMDTSAAGSSIEIRIRPLLWPFSTMIGVAVMLWVAWKMASLPLSIPRKVVTIVVMTDFVGLLASIFIATELITVG